MCKVKLVLVDIRHWLIDTQEKKKKKSWGLFGFPKGVALSLLICDAFEGDSEFSKHFILKCLYIWCEKITFSSCVPKRVGGETERNQQQRTKQKRKKY